MISLKEKLIKILDDLKENTGAISVSLNTEDGLIIAANSNQSDEIIEKSFNFAAISASILSMAEKGIEIISNNKILQQIKIDAGNEKDEKQGFTILITRVIANVLLQIIFSNQINIGLIQFEANMAIRRIKDLFKEFDKKDLFQKIGSLL